MDRDKLVVTWKRFRSLPELWPGWEHDKTPVAYFDDHEVLLIRHPNPPTGFHSEDILGVSVHLRSPRPPEFIANTDIEVNSIRTATIRCGALDDDAQLALTAHEAFHVFQTETGFPTANVALMTMYPSFSPEINALGEVEGRLLHRALCGPKGSSQEAVCQALDARAARQALLAPELREYEDQNELHEGLATYVEVRACPGNSLHYQQRVDSLLRLNREGSWIVRHRFYFSGMAYGLLCDRFTPGWQRRVQEEHQTPATLRSWLTLPFCSKRTDKAPQGDGDCEK